MKKLTEDKNRSGERGIGLVEFAFIIPIILTIAFTGLEFSRYMKTTQILGLATKQAANVSFRECRSLSAIESVPGDQTTSTLWGCLAPASTSLQDYLTSALPGAELVVSVYDYDAVTNTVTRVAITGVDDVTFTTLNGYSSRYSPFTILGEVSSFSAFTSRLFVSEIFYDFPSSLPTFSQFSFTPRVFYETAIY